MDINDELRALIIDWKLHAERAQHEHYKAEYFMSDSSCFQAAPSLYYLPLLVAQKYWVLLATNLVASSPYVLQYLPGYKLF